MKILQLSKYYPPTHGGLELVAEFFSRASVVLKNDVTVVALGESTKNYTGRYGEKVLQSKEDIKLNSSPFSLRYFLNVRKEITENRPDVILLHLPHPYSHEIAKWVKSSSLNKNLKIVGIFHSDVVKQVHLKDAYNFHFKRHLEIYDYFLCSSKNLKDSSEILAALPDERVRIIPFCIDHTNIGKPISRPGKFLGKFITIGRLVPYKGYEFLINCFNSLPYELTIIGTGPLNKELQKIANYNIKFLGEVSEEQKFKLMNTHDALIMSSINKAEAYGMTIVEAFSVGLPVIAADINTGVSFLVKHEKTGLKFKVQDEASLKLQMGRLETDQQLRQAVSLQCFEFFQKDLNFGAFCANLEAFLESCIAEKPKQALELRIG